MLVVHHGSNISTCSRISFTRLVINLLSRGDRGKKPFISHFSFTFQIYFLLLFFFLSGVAGGDGPAVAGACGAQTQTAGKVRLDPLGGGGGYLLLGAPKNIIISFLFE